MRNNRVVRASRPLLVIAALLTIVTLIFVGCGGSGGSSSIPFIGGTTSPTGDLVLVPTLAAAKTATKTASASASMVVPSGVTHFHLIGYDLNRTEVYSTTVPKVSPVNLTGVPTTVASMRYELLQGGVVVGSGNFGLQIFDGQTTTINDPPFTLIVTGTNALLPAGQQYQVTGADSGTAGGGTLSGNVTFDGNGGVTAGTITRTNIFNVPNPTTAFNVTGGTYQISANRNFTATLNATPYNLTLRGQVSRSPAGGAIYAAIYGNSDLDALSGVAVLQLNGSGFSTSSLQGTFATNAFDVTFSSPSVGFSAGVLQFDGAGNVTGSLQGLGGADTWTGTYTVSPTGVVNASLAVGGGTAFALQGAVGTDSVLTLAGATGNANLDQYFLISSPVTLGQSSVVNVQPTMYAVGMRSLTGGIAGVASFNAGNNTITGGAYDEFSARTLSIVTTTTPFEGGSFSVTTGGQLQGNRQGSLPLQLVGGVFTQSQAVYFGTLIGGTGDPLQFNQQLLILAQ